MASITKTAKTGQAFKAGSPSSNDYMNVAEEIEAGGAGRVRETIFL